MSQWVSSPVHWLLLLLLSAPWIYSNQWRCGSWAVYSDGTDRLPGLYSSRQPIRVFGAVHTVTHLSKGLVLILFAQFGFHVISNYSGYKQAIWFQSGCSGTLNTVYEWIEFRDLGMVSSEDTCSISHKNCSITLERRCLLAILWVVTSQTRRQDRIHIHVNMPSGW